MELGIEAIGSYLPERRVQNEEHRERFKMTSEFLVEKLGVIERRQRSEFEETSDMCVMAFEALTRKRPISPLQIECLVVCTQNPDGHGLPHTAAVVHDKLGVSDRCAAFDVGLGCSGFVYTLAVMQSFMEANGMGCGVLFTADPYSKIVDPEDRNTALLFGDAACAVLISAQGPRYRLVTTEFGTRGAERAALENVAGRFRMDGRAVFNFVLTLVAPQVRRVMDRCRWSMDDVDWLVFHQGSRFMLQTLCAKAALPPHKVPIEMDRCGNTVSSSIPLILERIVDDRRASKVIISGFGVGLSWATGALRQIDGETETHHV